MTPEPTPRQMVKALLRGEEVSRPLIAPMIFALGARLENLPPRAFQANTTRIANALRQIRNVLKVDALTCYCDPFLEAEALGCKRQWHEDGSCGITLPSFSSITELRDQLGSPDVLASQGFVPVACEVVRRLKTMLKDEPALMVRLTAPLSLAAQLSGSVGATISREMVEYAVEVTADIAKTFAEAGADIIVLADDSFAQLSPERGEWYASLLNPINNMLRFFEVLPVHGIGPVLPSSVAPSGCLVCLMMTGETAPSEPAGALALPAESFSGGNRMQRGMFYRSKSSLSFITSDSDLPSTIDIKQLNEGMKSLREWLAS